MRLPPSARREIASPRAAAHRTAAKLTQDGRAVARATPAHPASGRGVGKDASFEEHHLAKPCCARTCIRLLAAEPSLLKNLSSRSAIAIANADGPNPKTQAA